MASQQIYSKKLKCTFTKKQIHSNMNDSSIEPNLRPFLRQHIKQFVLDVSLNYNLIVSCHRAAARKTTSKELARDLEINVFNTHKHKTWQERSRVLDELKSFLSSAIRHNICIKRQRGHSNNCILSIYCYHGHRCGLSAHWAYHVLSTFLIQILLLH